jgi:folate-dependent phosphoribosylglycinamide formyltransferase PurN
MEFAAEEVTALGGGGTAATFSRRASSAGQQRPLRVVTFGSTHPFTKPLLDLVPALSGFEHVGHISTWDDRSFLRDPDSDAARAYLTSLSPDLFVASGYGRILRPRTLAIPRIGSINVHPSLLPAYRGYEAPRWALYFGEREIGVTVHEMIIPVDSGRILVQRSCRLDPDDDLDAVYARLAGLIPEALRVALERVAAARRIEGRPQTGGASYFSKPWREEARLELDLSLPAAEVVRRARVFPGHCSVRVGRRRVFFASVEPVMIPRRMSIRRRLRYVDVRAGDGEAVRLHLRRPVRSWVKFFLGASRSSFRAIVVPGAGRK